MRRSAAAATEQSEVTEIAHSAFLRHLQTRPDLLNSVVMMFCTRLNDCQLRIEALGHRDAEERIGQLLLTLATRPHIADRSEAKLAVTHRELALMAAMTRAHVTVVLDRFKLAGAIDYKRSGRLIVRIAALQQVLGANSERRSRRTVRRPARAGSR